ncbi:hypothetical protein ABTY98_23100 [Streptomyces sp. NPDC096040]|uniref:hypothetical protein n=1 Tax=Streptomyces sp. NPDC096040 TaxID=3155541 RepID=UPI003321938B
MTSPRPTTTLWRPTGPVEIELVRELERRAWPPRLPEQPIFYPVLDEDYAIKIARDWNVKHDGAGFVTRFEVDTEFVRRYPVQQAGRRHLRPRRLGGRADHLLTYHDPHVRHP